MCTLVTSLDARLERALGGGYEVRRLIGHGGFATVYSAFDTQLKRDVAIKVLRPELATEPVMRARFRREAEAVARLRHPNIVPIYAVGEGDGLVWYVMPLVTGESLRARLEREGRLPVALASRFLIEAVEALGAAHRAGLVHRDIKPDNILLDGDAPSVLLTDFGIAKALAGDPGGSALTATGVVIGTPQYMSPEQASGEAVDQRSDIYSLGVVAYQMLAGEAPFSGGTVAAILVKQVTEDAPTVTRRRPDCPPHLAVAIARCLAKSPDDRWPSADELLAALSSDDDRETREVRRSGGAPLFGVADPPRRFRRLLLGMAAVLVGCLAVDMVRGAVLALPLGALLAAFVVAAQYGRLWTAGYDWRDVLTRKARAGPIPSPISLDVAEFGSHFAAIHQARNDRAAMVAVGQRMPNAERRRVTDALPTVDALLARAADAARQLHALERQVDPGPVEIERRLGATRAEPPSPGREQRLALLERRRDAVRAIETRRERAARLLADHLGAIGRLRAEMERAVEGGGEGTEALSAALRGAEACLRSADLASPGPVASRRDA